METNSLEISLLVYPRQMHARLFELPESLATALESSVRPMLQVKTSEADQSKRPGGTAILCTPDQTFELRHLQSSNVLHLLEPSDDPTNETTGTRAGLSLAAQCDGLLELVPVTPNAHLYLAQQLPDLAKDREALDQGLPTAASKAQACRVAPFSQAEFERAWQDVCACEVDGQAYVPRASGLKIAWESLGLAATAEGIDLGRQFRTEDLLQGTGDQAVPKVVLLAVLQRVGSSDEGHTDGCLLGLAFSKMPDAKHVIGMRVDRDKCIEWTGAMLLECLDAPVTTTDFIKQWQAVLPEAWEALGTLATLQGRYQELDGGTIVPQQTDGHGTLAKEPDSKWHARMSGKGG